MIRRGMHHKDAQTLLEALDRGDRHALARLITLLDSGQVDLDSSAPAPRKRQALKLGLTGAAGAGKSTLAGALIKHLRSAGESVAVLACDPASPLSGGALLGDRVRMDHDASDAGVFVRSIAVRHAAGGLAASTGPIVRLLERFGFANILVETVGAGQDQLAVRGVVDVLVLLVTPGSGDSIQWQKAGLLEVADIIAVNKADLPGADTVAAELRATLDLGAPAERAGKTPVLKIVAARGAGMGELWHAVQTLARREIAPRVSTAQHAPPPGAESNGSDESGIHPDRGFLPWPDPLARLGEEYAAWEQIAGDLPKLLVSDQLRRAIDALPLLAIDGLADDRQLRRAMLLLSFLGHAYVWGSDAMVERIPAPLAVPWHAVAQRLGRPPVLSYASYALDNWRRMDPSAEIALGNIALRQNFLGGVDEEWFVLVHVEIEAEAAPALAALRPAQQAAAKSKPDQVAQRLCTVAAALERMLQTLRRMPERCDPYIYFNRVRPYIHGWKDHPALPRGLIYEGVGAYAGQPMYFRGETGAQSGIVPALDAALDIHHRDDPLRPYLAEMRTYMPPEHRAFVEALERGPSVRRHVLQHAADAALRDAYNACIHRLAEFRALHLEYAARYIFQQAQRDAANPRAVGTGGTPFMPYLGKHRDETLEHEVRS